MANMTTQELQQQQEQGEQQQQVQQLEEGDVKLQSHVVLTHDSIEIDYESLPENSSLVAQLSAGAFAGILEHTVMYPVDAIKTRLQIFQPGNSISMGIIQSATKISSSEGAILLWRGISSVVLGAGPLHLIYFSVFETTKTSLVNYMQNNTQKTNLSITNENHPLIASVSGIVATTLSDLLMTPFDVLKQRMQTYPTKISLNQIAHRIYQNEGLSSFFVSYPTTLFLSIPFAAINFGVYEYSSSILNPTNVYNPMLHCISGGISGALLALITTPLDCVKTALQTRGISKDPNLIKAKGFKDLTIALFKQNGYKSFLRGLRPRVVFNVPSTAISWTAYEMLKLYLIKE